MTHIHKPLKILTKPFRLVQWTTFSDRQLGVFDRARGITEQRRIMERCCLVGPGSCAPPRARRTWRRWWRRTRWWSSWKALLFSPCAASATPSFRSSECTGSTATLPITCWMIRISEKVSGWSLFFFVFFWSLKLYTIWYNLRLGRRFYLMCGS